MYSRIIPESGERIYAFALFAYDEKATVKKETSARYSAFLLFSMGLVWVPLLIFALGMSVNGYMGRLPIRLRLGYAHHPA
jgi:hypothetical protein